jgi:glycosyltransferase involved in cell wall biosynthesis
MLSILIPTHNYDTFQLVKELHNQAIKECIEFEIIVSDDASSNEELITRNKETGEYDRVMMDSKTNEIIFDTKSLEVMGFEIDKLKIMKRFEM